MSEQELDSHNSIRLNRQETQLMSYFMLNENKELSTEELLTHVWKMMKMSIVRWFGSMYHI